MTHREPSGRTPIKLLEKRIILPTNSSTLTLIPFGDLHADSIGFAESLWEECVTEIRNTPDTIALGMGDYFNLLRGKARAHMQTYTADEESFERLDDLAEESARGFYRRWLEPIKGKIIGLLEGNHYYRFSKSGLTTTQLMCQMGGIPYLESLAAIRLVVCCKAQKTEGRVLTILAHHGDWSGGYSRPGGDLNAMDLKSISTWDADISLYGHTHRKLIHFAPVMTLSRSGALRVKEKPRVIIRTGSFLRGYIEGKKGYIESKLLPPSELGYPRLYIKFIQAKHEGDRRGSLEAHFEARF